MNTVLLEQKISDSGLKKKYIAKEMGLTVATFNNKAKGRTEFLGSEINKLCTILKIDNPKQKADIFLV